MKYYQSNRPSKFNDLQEGAMLAYQISRPTTVNSNDVTRQQYGVIKHPINDDYMIVVEDGDIPIHADTATQASNGSINGHATFYTGVADANRVRGKVNASTNGKVRIFDMIPVRWQEKTHAQLDSDGWFDVVAP